jgi:hypothetical protein
VELPNFCIANKKPSKTLQIEHEHVKIRAEHREWFLIREMRVVTIIKKMLRE